MGIKIPGVRGRKRSHAAYVKAVQDGVYQDGSHDRKMARYSQKFPDGK